ncbi:MAG: adenylate kinase [Candidatus Omnitrophica bacterium]|nr:adenylate kinase [Candidatus Omnitrophota bacterium]
MSADAQSIAITIGITGRRRAGKDTIADYICARYGADHFTRKLAVADPIRAIARDVFGFSVAQLESALKDEIDPRWGATPREILQFVGTDMFRVTLGARFPSIGADIWARSLRDRIESASRGIIRPLAPHIIVVSDVRFPNEAQVLRDLGGAIIRVRRAVGVGANDEHASETAGDAIDADYEIANDCDLSALYERADAIVQKIIADARR